MLRPIIILSLLFIADRRRHRETSAVGYADSIVPGATTRVFRSTKEAVDHAAESAFSGGTFQGEVEIVQDGYAISDDLAAQAGVDTFESTKGGLRKALTTLKRRDGALLYVENPQNLTIRYTPQNVLQWYDENYEPEQRGSNYTNDDAYLYTLYLIATGAKFHWKNKTTSSGAVTSYGLESSLFGKSAPGEKKAYRAIIAKKGEKGWYPEQLGEALSGASGSDEVLTDGVLEALSVAPTPKRALEILTDILVRNQQENIPRGEYENMEFTTEETPTYFDFNVEDNNLPF